VRAPGSGHTKALTLDSMGAGLGLGELLALNLGSNSSGPPTHRQADRQEAGCCSLVAKSTENFPLGPDFCITMATVGGGG
jgi:hypothetical protein